MASTDSSSGSSNTAPKITSSIEVRPKYSSMVSMGRSRSVVCCIAPRMLSSASDEKLRKKL
jgi:hypothetical protein